MTLHSGAMAASLMIPSPGIRSHAHLERRALHNSQDDGRPPILPGRGSVNDSAHSRCIVVLCSAPECVRQQLVGNSSDKVFPMAQQSRAGSPAHPLACRRLTHGSVNRRACFADRARHFRTLPGSAGEGRFCQGAGLLQPNGQSTFQATQSSNSAIFLRVAAAPREASRCRGPS
jgi:hypothetical protein